MSGRAALLLLLLASCDACRPERVVILPPPPVADGDGGDACSLACGRLVQQRCGPIASVSRCAMQCWTDQAQGSASQLDPGAVLDASTLPQLSAIAGVPCLGAAP